jgi:hypothetical protein
LKELEEEEARMHNANNKKSDDGNNKNNDDNSVIDNSVEKRAVFIGLTSVLLGICCFAANMYTYPYLLPRVLTSENLNFVLLQGYIFYMVFFASVTLTAIGGRKLYNAVKENEGSIINCSSSRYGLLSLSSFVRVITKVFDDRRYLRLFWFTSVCYGIFYAIVSNTIIYRSEGLLEHGTSATVPSSLIMQYGPAGYAPAVAVILTENIGFLIVPLNLSLLLFASVMVGLNIALSTYSIRNRTRTLMKGSFLGSAGASTALFSVCPTCASFYLFSAIAGPLAFTISAFTASFYLLFSVISIPSLIAGAIITAAGIHRMIIKSGNSGGNSCGGSINSCSVGFGDEKI